MEKAVKENDFHQAALLKEQLAECEKKREDILQEMNLNKINEPQRVEKVLNSKNIFLFHYQHCSLSLSLSLKIILYRRWYSYLTVTMNMHWVVFLRHILACLSCMTVCINSY